MKKLLCVLLSILMVFSACSVITGVVFATTYSVSAAAGGTASVNGNTYTATPYYGNTFAGWYEENGASPVSVSTEFTTDVYSFLEARFNVYNQIVDGSFENGTAGQDYFNLYSGSNAGKNNVIAAVPEESSDIHGDYALYCEPTATSSTARYLLHMPVTVEKNTTYAFHMSFYMPGHNNSGYIGLIADGYDNSYTAYGELAKWSLHWAKEGEKNETAWSYLGSQDTSTFFQKTINKGIGLSADKWIDVMVLIETGEDDKIFKGQSTGTVYISFGLVSNEILPFYVDNVCFAKASKTFEDTEVTATGGGYIEAIGNPQKTPSSLVYYDTDGGGSADAYDTHVVADSTHYSTARTSSQKYTARAYNDNLFQGWYDENGTLVTTGSDVDITTQKALTAKFINNNQVPDGDFSLDKGVDFWTSITNNKNLFITTGGTGIDGKGLNVQTTGNCLMTARLPVTVKKSTDYVYSFNFKVNSYSATQKDDGNGNMVDSGTPVFSQMVSGSPSGANNWGNWPKLASWKITIRNAEDYTKSYSVTGNNAACTPQIKFADIAANCGEGWLEFIFEFNTGSDTTNGETGDLFATADTATMYMSLGMNFAQSNIDYDNFSFYENSYSPIFNSKENVSVSRVGIGTVAAGADYSFKLAKAASASATVRYNGKTITPVNDVYSIDLVADKNVYISLSDDENYPVAGKDFYGNDLTKYDHSTYNTPIWEGNTVYHETAVFYPDRTEISLVYPIDRIVSVRSFDLQYYYVKGVDFDVVDGKLVLLPDSSIPVYPHTPLKPTGSGSWASDFDGYDVTGYSGGSVYPCTLAVTYEHSKTWADLGEDGYAVTKQESVAENLSVFDKLVNGEDVHIVFYGDSMTSGWSISGGKVNVYTEADDGTTVESGLYTAPYAPSWMQMFIDGLKKEYPTANITFENLSLGGKASGWGLQHFEGRYNLLSNKDIDLFLLGWGINDCGASVTPATFKQNEQDIINALRAKCPDASVLMYSGNCTNVDAAMYNRETMLGYQAAIGELANENDNAAATVLTELFFDVMESKESSDIFENNLNHTNDFGCRLYSQVMITAMTGEHSGSSSTTTESYTDEEKALSGYDADQMGDTYTRVVASNQNTYSVPFSVEAGSTYLAHFKLLVRESFANMPLASSALTIAVDGEDAVLRISSESGTAEANGTWSTSSWFGSDNQKLFGNGFVDVYAIIDATNGGTVNLTITQPDGGVMAIDCVTMEKVSQFAPTMLGATFNPLADPDAQKIMYVTNIDLPSYLALGSIHTYMGVTSALSGTEDEFTFTSDLDNVTSASLVAYESVRYITLPRSKEAFRSGDVYSTFNGADTAAATTKFSVRSVITLTDAFGNALDISLGTENTASGIENGVYSRSINQIKRLLAKNLINAHKNNASLAKEMISYSDEQKLYNGPIEEVWKFIVTCVNLENTDRPGTFPEVDEEGTDDLI